MNTIFFSKVHFFSLLICIIHYLPVHGQEMKLNYGQAFNALNSGSSKKELRNAGFTAPALNGLFYKATVVISYGIPIEVVMEYAAVQNNLRSDMASDPNTYQNSPVSVRKVMNDLANSSFTTISDFHQVTVQLNFQFNPAKLVQYGTDTGDYLNSTQSSPWDPGVYQMPQTPVSGTKTMNLNQ